jgi:hypothetical protein
LRPRYNADWTPSRDAKTGVKTFIDARTGAVIKAKK